MPRMVVAAWMPSVVSSCVFALLLPRESRGSVTFLGVQNSSSPIAFSEAGTFVAAGNFTGTSDTRGTNAFQSEVLSGTSSSQSWSAASGLSVSLSAPASDTLLPADLGSATDKIYLTEIYTQYQSTETLKISGLSAASSYIIEFPHGENRNLLYSGTQMFTDSSNNTATGSITFGNATGDQFALVDVAVSNSTSLTYTMPSGGRGPSFDAWDVRLVPEPTSLAVFCAAPLLLRRRR